MTFIQLLCVPRYEGACREIFSWDFRDTCGVSKFASLWYVDEQTVTWAAENDSIRST